jgi:hypothetical protein
MSIILLKQNDDMSLTITPSTVIIEDEGTPQGAVLTLDFVGAGVTASVTGNEATITIPGGAGTPPLLPVTGTGTATGAVVGDLDGNDFTINDGAKDIFFIDASDEEIILTPDILNIHANTTLGGYADGVFDGSAGNYFFNLEANDGAGTTVGILGSSVTGSVTHTAGTHILQGNGYEALNVQTSAGNESGVLRARNTTGNGNQGQVDVQATNTDVTSTIKANFNDGVKLAQIQAFADATTATITHTADTHNINGDINAPALLIQATMFSRNNYWSAAY